MCTLAEVVAKRKMDYLRAQLSDDYESFLPDGEEVPRDARASRSRPAANA
jgi:hypothetical protein